MRHLVHRRLADGAIHHKHDFVWLDRLDDCLHLVEQALLLLVAPARVHDDQVHALLLELFNALPAHTRVT